MLHVHIRRLVVVPLNSAALLGVLLGVGLMDDLGGVFLCLYVQPNEEVGVYDVCGCL
jgi:hypothetical protein